MMLTDDDIRDALEAEFLGEPGNRNLADDLRVARAAIAALRVQAAPALPQCAIYEKADSLYKRGYTDRQNGKDYDPRGCDEWQEVIDWLTPAAPVDEREAFEGEMRCEEVWGHRSLKKKPDGRYENWCVALMWDVWQARAALQSSVADAVLAEREACAKVCEELDRVIYDDPGAAFAAAIRARNGGV